MSQAMSICPTEERVSIGEGEARDFLKRCFWGSDQNSRLREQQKWAEKIPSARVQNHPPLELPLPPALFAGANLSLSLSLSLFFF